MFSRIFLSCCAVSLFPLAPAFAQNSSQLPPPNSPIDQLASGFAPVDSSPENSTISGLLRSADQAAKNRDYSSCAQFLERVVAIEPKIRNAWNYLGWTYNALGQYEKAEAALRQAIAVDPSDLRAYNNLGQALFFQKKYDEAILFYKKQIALNPKDPWAHTNLGRMYMTKKEYANAIPELEIAQNISPQDANIQFYLGRCYARSSQPEKAVKSLQLSVQLQPVPIRMNDVAYELAEDNLDLPVAEKYEESAIAATVLEMRETSLEHLSREDLFQATRLIYFWDTLGWIKFRMGDLITAERYVKSAWLIYQNKSHGEHLAQIYEKQGRKADAIKMYQMTLALSSESTLAHDRLSALAGPEANLDALAEEGHKLLKEVAPIRIANKGDVEGFAEFWILLSPGPVVRGAKFISGDDELNPFAKTLASASYPDVFPEATEVRIARRARLSCTHSSPDCRLRFTETLAVPAGELPSPPSSIGGSVGRVVLDASVSAAKLIKKVLPVYPVLARNAGIDGVVRLHVVISRDGTISKLEILSGHPLLVQSAMDAVKQWVFQPTLVEGVPVEVDTTIDVYFSLNK